MSNEELGTENRPIIIEGDDDNVQVFPNGKNPFLIPPVIECIYQYLSLKDIKNCRLVSDEWRLSSNQILRKRARIVISNKIRRTFTEFGRFSISEFLEDFSETSNRPFSAFSFRIPYFGQLQVNDINEFFENHKRHMKELDLRLEYYIGRKSVEWYNITPWITDSLMSTPDANYNTKFSAVCPLNDKVRRRDVGISVALSALMFIKEIRLIGIVIQIAELNNESKLSPIKLDIQTVQFMLGEYKATEIRINDVVNFVNCKSVILKNDHRDFTKIALDLRDHENILSFDSLTLENVTVSNWATSIISVNKLTLCNVPLTESCGMRIDNLNIGHSHINLACLPESLESLDMTHEKENMVTCSHPIFLPNLKIVYFHILSLPHLSHFKMCPELIELHVDGEWPDTLVCSLGWIPKSIKRICFEITAIKWAAVGEGESPLLLHQLCILCATYDNVRDICIPHIQVKDLILLLEFKRDDNHRKFVELLEHLYKRIHPPQRIFVGPVFWYRDEYSLLRKYVDKKDTYYVFEHKRGKAIHFLEFDTFKDTAFNFGNGVWAGMYRRGT